MTRFGALALALLLSLGACTQFKRLIGVREVALPVHHGYVATDDGAQLFFRVVGSGRDTVIVLHGGPGFHMGSLVNFELLAAGGALIFYDQRGGGRSSLPADASQLTAARHVADLDAVRRHFNLRSVTLLGHSWGGLLAGLYAVEHSPTVSRLILVAPGFLRAAGPAQEYLASLPRTLGVAVLARARTLTSALDTASAPHALCAEIATLLWRAGSGSDSAAVRLVVEGLCAPNVPAEAIRHGWTSTPRAAMGSLGMWDLRPRLRSVPARTLVIIGGRDPLGADGAREWVGALPNARLEIVPATGHFVFADDPVRFATLVRVFLGRD